MQWSLSNLNRSNQDPLVVAENFGSNIGQYFPLKLLEYIVIISIIIVSS